MRNNAPKPRQIKPPKVGKIIIPANAHPWPHELRVARILANAGRTIEFLPTGNHKTPDILLDGIEFEIKSPETVKLDSVEQLIRKAIKQSPNIIIDASRCKIRATRLHRYLERKCREQKQIKSLLLIAKTGQIVYISDPTGQTITN